MAQYNTINSGFHIIDRFILTLLRHHLPRRLLGEFTLQNNFTGGLEVIFLVLFRNRNATNFCNHCVHVTNLSSRMNVLRIVGKVTQFATVWRIYFSTKYCTNSCKEFCMSLTYIQFGNMDFTLFSTG